MTTTKTLKAIAAALILAFAIGSPAAKPARPAISIKG